MQKDDVIYRQAAIEAQERIMSDYPLDGYEDERLLINALKDLPPVQPELIEKAAYIRGFEQGRTQVMIDTKAEEVSQPNLQPTCNNLATDLVSRKAVREMVATWSYDMAEWEDMELALHDVDELPPAQLEVIHYKDCDLWHRVGCPMNIFVKKPEPGYFCGTGRRKENE